MVRHTQQCTRTGLSTRICQTHTKKCTHIDLSAINEQKQMSQQHRTHTLTYIHSQKQVVHRKTALPPPHIPTQPLPSPQTSKDWCLNSTEHTHTHSQKQVVHPKWPSSSPPTAMRVHPPPPHPLHHHRHWYYSPAAPHLVSDLGPHHALWRQTHHHILVARRHADWYGIGSCTHTHSLWISSWILTPSLPPACEISGLKNAHLHA